MDKDPRILMHQRFIGPRFEGASLSKVKLPHDISQKLHKFLQEPKNFLVFLGNPGIGKTYFCSALMPWAVDTFITIRYWNEDRLLQSLREKISEGQGDYLKNLSLMIDDDLVILDDIGCNKPNEWREEVLFETIDSRYNTMKPTVITSNLSKQEFIDRYHPRVASRLFATENTIIETHDLTDMRQLGI